MSDGAIAAALAAQEAARAQRRMEQDVARKRARRKAAHAGTPMRVEPDRLAQRCALHCLGCGHLAVAPDSTDPMRHDDTAWRDLPCVACGSHGLVDLADVPAAEALRAAERREIELRRGVVISLAACTGLLVMIVATVRAAFGHGVDPVSTAAMVACCTGGIAHYAARVHAAWTTPRRTAWRWRAPTRVVSPRSRMGAATVVASRSVPSPIDDRPVAGWRIEVRYPSDRGDQLALVEQRCAPIQLGDVALAREPSIATTAVEVDPSEKATRRYLESRGIDPNDRIAVTLRVIVDGDAVEVLADADGGNVVVASRVAAV